MRIELTSTLTQDDEDRLAPALLKALSGLLDMLPIAYMIRVETSEHVLQHVSPKIAAWEITGVAGVNATPDPQRHVIES